VKTTTTRGELAAALVDRYGLQLAVAYLIAATKEQKQ